MSSRLSTYSLSIALLFVFGHFNAGVKAGRIELDNTAGTTSSQFPNVTTRLNQFSRFSAGGELLNQGFAPAPCFAGTQPFVCGPTQVYVYSLSDYGITNANLGQVGSLIQIQFNLVLSGQAGTGFGNVTVFLVDPANTGNRIMLSTLSVTGSSNSPVTGLFNLSQFGPLPGNITPDFYIGLTGGVFVNSTGMSGSGSSLSILSTVPTPEPATFTLLLSGLAASGALWRRRRSK